MKYIKLAILALLLTACATKNLNYADYVSRYHDDEKRVTCWIFSVGQAGGISCIPDSQLEREHEN